MICRKVVRQVYYLLQVLLGVGSAGTPSPTPGKACTSTFVHLCIHPSACVSQFVCNFDLTEPQNVGSGM